MPFIIPLTYRFLIPSPSSFTSIKLSILEEYNDEEISAPLTGSYTPIPCTNEGNLFTPKTELELRDKWRIVKPLFAKFMLPLCEWHFYSLAIHWFIWRDHSLRVYSMALLSSLLVMLTCSCSSNTPLIRFEPISSYILIIVTNAWFCTGHSPDIALSSSQSR